MYFYFMAAKSCGVVRVHGGENSPLATIARWLVDYVETDSHLAYKPT